ncbi:MAG: TolC family protein [Myxococcaceae bacterium]|nr:TolC family protein [Myxococcaceae bacterium]
MIASSLALLIIAQSAGAAPLTLGEALAITRKAAPAALSAEATEDAARARAHAAFGPYLPAVSLGGLGRYDHANFAPVVVGTPFPGASAVTFPFVSSARYSFGVTVDQLLFDGGRTRGNREMAQARLESARADRDTTTASLELATATAFIEALEADALHRLERDAGVQARLRVEQARRLYSTGLRPELDVLAAETLEAQAVLRERRTAVQVERSLQRLASAMGVEKGGYRLVEPNLSAGVEEALAGERQLELAASRRAELKSLAQLVRLAESSVDVARSAYFPSVALNGGVLATGTDRAPGPFFDVSAGLTFRQSLFEGLQTYHSVEAAMADARAARARLDERARLLQLEVVQAALAVKEASLTFETARQVSDRAERQFALATERYHAGLSGFLELSDAQALSVQARSQEIQARAALAIGRLGLRRALGLPLVPRDAS